MSSTIQAAVLILAQEILRALGRRASSAREMCQLTGASPSQAYAMVARLREALGRLRGSPGRRRSEPPCDAVASQVLLAVRDVLMANPGCVEMRGGRRLFHACFRELVLEQIADGGTAAALPREEAARLFGVPLGTLKEWLAQPKVGAPGGEEPVETTDAPSPMEMSNPTLALILDRFPRWRGTFEGFCRHLQLDHRLSQGRTFVASVLDMAGLRRRCRRGRDRRPWSLGAFAKLFPGAQWIGDGKRVVIDWLDHRLAFNLELLLDPGSDAAVGVAITDTEDEEAVIAAYAQALATTGATPLAVTLDQRGSNHTERVREAVSPAELLASTKARPTAKAPVEGAFGLFSQTLPPLQVTGDTSREQARSVLSLVAWAWFLGRNGRPRSRLGGRSPAQVYADSSPTQEDVAQAKEAIAELRRREERFRQTLEAKADPVRRTILQETLQAFGIADPDDRLALSLSSSYSTEAILQGLAIFRAKWTLGTLPPDADRGPYLAGIIRNVHGQLEDEAVAETLLDLRLRHRELSLAHLDAQAEKLARQDVSPFDHCTELLVQALRADALVDFGFWLRRFAQVALETAALQRRAFYNLLVTRIARSYRTDRDRRRQLLAALSAAAVAAG